MRKPQANSGSPHILRDVRSTPKPEVVFLRWRLHTATEVKRVHAVRELTGGENSARAQTHACTDTHMCTHACTDISKCTHACAQTHACAHTHVHTHTRTFF